MRKRFLVFIVSTLMMVLMMGVCANAETKTGSCGDSATYSFDTATGTLTINGTGKINDGYNVVGKNNIKQVNISEGITSIGGSTFEGCTSLTKVTIPSSVSEMEKNVFKGCTGLKSVGPIGSGSNVECGWKIIIPDYAFSECTSLTSVTIPDNVKLVGVEAFSECTNLTNVIIPNSVTEIGPEAFRKCTGLTNITIPDSVTSLAREAFKECTGLTNIIIPNRVTFIGFQTFWGCTGLTSVIIPNSVTEIRSEAFQACKGLESVTIPYRVTIIEDRAFSSFNDKMVINGYDNTEAQRYALKDSIKYNSLGIAHKVTLSTKYASFSEYKKETQKELMYVVGEKYNEFPKLYSKESPNLSLVGWFTEKDGGTQITEDTVCTLTGDATFYAHWEEVDEKLKVKTEVKQFVNRLYTILLDREAEADGLENWSAKLADGSANAAQIVEGIVNSDEFNNKNLSNDEIVERMYKAMLGRKSEEEGKNHWEGMLNKGLSVNTIINGFSGSGEFGKICSDYGINPGSISLGEPRDQNEGVAAFVARCYEKALGRTFEKDGINNWCNEILNAPDKRKRAEEVASDGFFHSQEFKNKNTSNDDYVEILYRTFLGREYDEAGKADWVGKLDSGVSRDDVLYGFSRSAEFANIMTSYGL